MKDKFYYLILGIFLFIVTIFFTFDKKSQFINEKEDLTKLQETLDSEVVVLNNEIFNFKKLLIVNAEKLNFLNIQKDTSSNKEEIEEEILKIQKEDLKLIKLKSENVYKIEQIEIEKSLIDQSLRSNQNDINKIEGYQYTIITISIVLLIIYFDKYITF